MRFLSPVALWWLLLAAVIIFFYLLKLKRKRRVVSSTLLWQRTLEEMEANAPFKKLRRSLLLLLQLAALAALVFSLARPLITTSAISSGSTVIIIDSTASMSARDEDGGSRLERAKRLAREVIEGLEGDERAAVIESSSRVAIRSPMTSDRAALIAAVDDVRETDTPGNLTDALRLATQIAKSERDTSVVIIGDGGGAPVANDMARTDALEKASAQQVAMRFVRVGQRADNLGIIAMNSRPSEGRRPELFASLANFSDREREVGLELRIEGRLVDARSVNIKAGERAGLVFDALPLAGGLAELKLGVEDDLAADNLAYAHLPDARPLRVGVSGDNPFLLQALAANPDFEPRRIGSNAPSDFDCIVFEGPVQPGILESNRPILAINPSDISGLWQATGQREAIEVASVDRSHPVNSFLNYSDLHIESAPSRETAAWLRPVVSASSGGLVWAGDDGSRRAVLLGFDLAKSDLPLKIEFPLLLANSINWLAGRNHSTVDRAVRAGQPIIIRGASEKVTLIDPTGESHEIEPRDAIITFAGTIKTGLYEASGQPSFAASLLSEAETDLTPRDSIKTRAGEVKGQVETFSSEREAWKWLALAALLVLAIEWWAYHRRI
ncbi:MAG TPA: BatA and WFA domain-containing protein [Blastocatellia bacterium]|nr:BatA and WFA domain-containing protein [Blastocatellia bacterium]